MSGTFFTSWELWQQMTFVLAMAIVAVFCAGLGKLWWNNRLVKKQEVLDEEKRARVEEMRKTGLPIKRTNNIPFGVRAIQSGVEVDGIWISRPASLNETASAKLTSSTSIAGRDSDSQKKRRDHPGNEKKAVLVTTTSLGDKRTPSAAAVSQKLTDHDPTQRPQSGAPPLSRFAYKARRQPSRPAGGLDQNTLQRLEGQPAEQPLYETYVPASSSRQEPRQPSQRSWESSSRDSVDSQSRSTSGKSYSSSSHSSRFYMARTTQGVRAGHDPPLGRCSEAEAASDPFATPARTPSGFSLLSQVDTPGPGAQGQGVSAPEPTFGPGDLHLNLNRSSRRVNDGFEILPAGALGMPRGMAKLEESEQNGQASGSSARLRKSGGWPAR